MSYSYEKILIKQESLVKRIVSDSNNIFLWRESQDTNKREKKVISNTGISVDSNLMITS